MNVITAPATLAPVDEDGIRVFMAGGITGCPDWQAEYIEQLAKIEGTLFNPRRKDFDVKDPTASEKQIRWEFQALHDADAVSFWFPSETLCPIVLFELGAWSTTLKKIFVGCHPSYQRRYDVVMQLRLSRPDVVVVQSLVELTAQVGKWVTLGG